MPEPPSGTVTFVFTDIEGSTRLERGLRERYGGVLAEHQRLLREAFAAHGGYEIDTQGDSFFYVFPRAKAAVEAVVEAQRALASHAWPAHGQVRVRIGLNTGEASLENGRYVGFAVHRAARIAAAGHGGQILLSSTTRELIEDDLPADQRVRDLGERRLKDLPRPERIYQLVVDDLPSEFGPLRTLDEQELAEAAQRALISRRYRRRLALAIPAAGLLGAAFVAAFLLTRGSESISVQTNSVVAIDPEENEVVGQVPVGNRPGAVAVGEGSVWVANIEDRTVSRVNPKTRRVDRTISLSGYPSDVAVGAKAIWVAHGDVSSVSRIDPKLYGVTTVPLPRRRGFGDPQCRRPPEAGLVAGNGKIWVICPDSVLVRIDPADNRADGLEFATGGGVALAFQADRVWVADRDQNSVFRVNPRSGLADQITVLSSPLGVAVDENAAWVANSGADAVSRIDFSDPETPLTSQSVSIGARPYDVAAGEGAIWTANAEEGTVSKIDPATGEVIATIEIGHRPVGLAVGAGTVWVTVQAAADGGAAGG
jgi:YVTN family beta-propeller protein